MGVFGPLGEVPGEGAGTVLGAAVPPQPVLMPVGYGGLDAARCVAAVLALGAGVGDVGRMLGLGEGTVEDIMMGAGYKEAQDAVGEADRRSAGEILQSVEVTALRALIRILQDPRSGSREIKSAAIDLLDRWQGKSVIRQETVFTEVDRGGGLEGLSDKELESQLSAVEERLGLGA